MLKSGQQLHQLYQLMYVSDILVHVKHGLYQVRKNTVSKYGEHNEVTLLLLVMYDDTEHMQLVKFVWRNDAHYIFMYDDILLLVVQDEDILADGTEVDVDVSVVILVRGYIHNDEVEELMLDITELHYVIDL